MTIFTGGADSEFIAGDLGKDILDAQAGDDTLDGGGGKDTLKGGLGNDTYFINNTGIKTIENLDSGIDVIISSLNHTLANNIENLTLIGTANNGVGNNINNIIVGNSNNNFLDGKKGNDNISGSSGNDTLAGREGNDTLYGGLDNDSLIGGLGNDSLIGGDGDDIYVVDDLNSTISENSDEGVDTVKSSVSFSLGANIENLVLTGERAISGTGNDLDNTITGNSGVNTLIGGAGDDTYVIGQGDIVIENTASGNDTILSSVTYSLNNTSYANIENLTLTGKSNIRGTGNSLDNIINGNIGNNILYGMDGNDFISGLAGSDKLDGGSGNDTLDGGLGIDSLTGGNGNDIYYVDNSRDKIYENSGGGTDTVYAGASYTLSSQVEDLVLTGIDTISAVGNNLNNDITGNINDNMLSGCDGNDTLRGNDGNDTLIGGTGNDALYGGQNADDIFGGTGNDSLFGEAGSDTLRGEAGTDTLAGGAGDDVYYIDNTSDLIIEDSGDGDDSVYSSISYTLSNNMDIEKIILTGSNEINATGNDLDNYISGNAKKNILHGGAGNDTLNSGGGNDILYGEDGDDSYIISSLNETINELSGQGIDTVYSSVSYTIDDNLENLVLTGTSAAKGVGNDGDNIITGNTSANTLIGNSGDDILDGREGADTLIGGEGNDEYYVDNTKDTVVENVGQGTDTISSGISWALGNNIEYLKLTGDKSINGIGNNLSNNIDGNSANNYLDGGAGNDTLIGNNGDDTLAGGNGTDSLDGGYGDDTYIINDPLDTVKEDDSWSGNDTVITTVSGYSLGNHVENLMLSGSSVINGSGNSLDNYITGNKAKNILKGYSGYDTLNGGGNSDTLEGGDGSDTYIINNTGITIIENSGIFTGNDTVISSINYNLGSSSNLENLTLTGSASRGVGNDLDNYITGNRKKNYLSGGLGYDTLNGGGGADTLVGGEDDDTYIVGNNGIKIIEKADEGNDTVYSSISYTLTSNVENLFLTGAQPLKGVGNSLNNYIEGNIANNIIDGKDGDNYIVGNDGNDSLIGGRDSDTLVGGIGNDILSGGLGSNSLVGGTENDTYYIIKDVGPDNKVIEESNEGNDTIISNISYTLDNNVENLILTGTTSMNGTGNNLNNYIIGNSKTNILSGGTGDDTLSGGGGSDTLRGQEDDDTYIINNAGYVVIEDLNQGNDTAISSIKNYVLANNVENLILSGSSKINGTGNSLDNYITGNKAQNILNGGGGNDTLDGDGGSDYLVGGLGNDTYLITDSKAVIREYSDGGTDLVQSCVNYTLSGNIETLAITGNALIGVGDYTNNTIIGNVLNNSLNGGAGNDLLQGDTGDDTLYGNTGNDTLEGQQGDDKYIIDSNNDLVTEDNDSGNDTVLSSVNYTLNDNVENLTLTGGNSINGTGNILDNYIIGNTKNNALSGSDGNDTLSGGGGSDTLIGGGDDDTYIVNNTGINITELSNQGIDIVYAQVSYSLHNSVENLILDGSKAINGTGNDLSNSITGNTNKNILSGGLGNDTIDGGGGKDTLIGGLGDDTYIVNNQGITIREDINSGIDTVISTINYSLQLNSNNLVLSGDDSLTGTGNNQDNYISGNHSNNILNGNGGNDTIEGNGGNDIINGGEGNDILAGGLDDDTYYLYDSNDTIIENENEGNDTVISNLACTLDDNLENLTLTGTNRITGNINGTGNYLNNYITGNIRDNLLFGEAGKDTLDGKLGNDSLYGGLDDDTYIITYTGTNIYEDSNQGIDTVLSSINYSLLNNLENLVLTGSSNLNGTGNNLNNSVKGNSGRNILTASGGDDTLDGDGGLDILIGGAGNDSYIIDNSGITILDLINEGSNDTVISSIDFSLMNTNIENLALTGTGYINGTGNASHNIITGNEQDNILDGDIGNDTLIGGKGNDTYCVDNINDVITELADEGNDTVKSSIDYSIINTYLENLTLTGSARNGVGNSYDNYLTGNSQKNYLYGGLGNDTIDGGTGNDTLEGGDGNDTYIVDTISDMIIEDYYIDETGTEKGGNDTVRTSINYTLDPNLENLVLTGTDSLTGTGNANDNSILGNDGNNTLYGLDGSDTLDGGIGNDLLSGGAGNDIYYIDSTGDVVSETLNGGIDTIYSAVSCDELFASVENLILLDEGGNINGKGNELDNYIIGNKSGNILNGGDGDDTLEGGEGDDTLDGGNGSNSLTGGFGSDLYIVDSTSDYIIENSNEGYDSVQSSTSYTLQGFVENLTLTGSNNINGAGNTDFNYIMGNRGNNILYSRGCDPLKGTDTLNGGGGKDTLVGSWGNDLYLVNDSRVTIMEEYTGGNDTIGASVSFTISNNVYASMMLTGTNAINGTASNVGNTIWGNRNKNILTGSIGDDYLNARGVDPALINNDTTSGTPSTYVPGDTLIGGLGNDTYVIISDSDVYIEKAGEGDFDEISISKDFSIAGTNIECLHISATGFTGIGSNKDNHMSGVGGDTLKGGLGNDTYYISGTFIDPVTLELINLNNGPDTFIENPNEGIDWVVSELSHSLAANIEHLLLSGTNQINGTGNNLDNTLQGNGFSNYISGESGNDWIHGGIYYLNGDIEDSPWDADTLDGGAGIDTLTGWDGDDTYYVDNPSDLIIEYFNSGNDTVFSSASFILGSNIESLTLTGTNDINGDGNSLENIIVGNTGKNILKGYAGNDTIDGGGGRDTIYGGEGSDIYTVYNSQTMVVENYHEGNDTVNSGVSFTLGDNIEDLILTGSGNINGAGNNLANSIMGNSGINYISGGAGADTINGNGGLDTLYGQGGNDTYIVNNFGVTILEDSNQGIDLVKAGVSFSLGSNIENLALECGSLNINGTGNNLNNIITGNDGNNILDGGNSGTDALEGGNGDDTYIINNPNADVRERQGEGNDTVKSSLSFALSDNIENLILTGTNAINGAGNGGDNNITGNINDNRLTGEGGNDTLCGGGGNDTLIGGYGNDTYVVDYSGVTILENPGSGEGIDTVQATITYTLDNSMENLTLTGTNIVTGNINGTGNNIDNSITGNIRNNHLYGLDGNDTLNGGGGTDTLEGGNGDDIYIINNKGIRIIETAEGGIDGIQTSINYTLADYFENLTLTGSNALNGTGNALNNSITGNSGRNELSSGLGDDTIDGGGGNDTLIGGTGNDSYIINNTGVTITELSNSGTDTVLSTINYTLGNYIENLVLVSSGVYGTGNSLNNLITGNEGNNILDDGGNGNDTLIGSKGDDTYIISSSSDIITELDNEGNDNIITRASYSLPVNVEHISASGTANITIAGNAYDNTITGNAGNNIITGHGGNDTIDGGAGADTMTGGDGNDTYIIDNSQDIYIDSGGNDTVCISVSYTLTDTNIENLILTGTSNIVGQGNNQENVITGNSGNSTLIGGAGNDTYEVLHNGIVIIENNSVDIDTVKAGINYTLSGNLENLTLICGNINLTGTGNNLDNTITGNDGNNTLNGGLAGNDTLIGGNGNDTYIIARSNVTIIEDGNGSGNDTVISSINYTITDGGVENLTLTGSSNISGRGNDLDNLIIGNSGNNSLYGEAGNDTLYGGLYEDDTLVGGTGNDTYVINYSGVTVVEEAGEGNDTVISLRDYSLEGTHIENLVLTGTSSMAGTSGTGNNLDNSITGNIRNNILSGGGGDDTLDGGLGSDTLIGGTGNDTYFIDSYNDAITENAGGGNDTVNSQISYTLNDNLENLTLTGSSNILGRGNDNNNSILGNSGNNRIYGEVGNDTLDGGGGNDTLIGGYGNDNYIISDSETIIYESIYEGTDSVFSTANYILSNHIENLTLQGGDIYGIGNTLSNTIIGSSGSNSLDGGTAGNDTLIGLDGNDTYYIDHTGVTVQEGVDSGIDTVNSSVNYTLSDNIENLNLTLTGNINGEGNSLDNFIGGNLGNNILIGGDGDDTINGYYGADTLIGGNGDDIYYIDNDITLITDSSGNDTVYSSIGYTLSDDLENLTLTGISDVSVTGNGFNNYIIGNSGLNTLDGGAGNDTLDSGGGNDTLIGGEGDDIYIIDSTRVTITDSSGIDTIETSVSYILGGSFENLTLTGSSDINGTGNTLNNIIIGNEGNNYLSGGMGNDTMEGAGGTDIIAGEDGNDTYIFNSDNCSSNIQDSSGSSDMIYFGDSITQANIAFYKAGTDLIIDFGTTAGTNEITIQNQDTATIERIEVAEGNFLTSADLSTIISYITSYDVDHSDVTLTSVANVRNCSELMTYINSAWHK